MIHRIVRASNNKSFFLFGARGTGKSTYIKKQWPNNHYYINLLLNKWEARYQRDPDLLISDVEEIKSKYEWIVIDEVQKIPKLLDIVHEIIETCNLKFVLTGSSARKLKRGSANLLAGRAFHNELFPLTYKELGNDFKLNDVLQYGSLPQIFSLNLQDKKEYLNSYCQTYLKEEILQEQIVRNGIAFRSFLEIAAQHCGKNINFSKIAKDINVDTKTIQNFFSILEDTLIGYMLPAYTKSIRKSVKKQPKFYLFDLGIKRAMENSLDNKIIPRTGSYGLAFEHFIVCEIFRLNKYTKSNYSMSHYQTTAGGEVDLVLSKASKTIAIEIKSTNSIDLSEIKKFDQVSSALNCTEKFYISQDQVSSKVSEVNCLYWENFLNDFFKDVS